MSGAACAAGSHMTFHFEIPAFLLLVAGFAPGCGRFGYTETAETNELTSGDSGSDSRSDGYIVVNDSTTSVDVVQVDAYADVREAATADTSSSDVPDAMDSTDAEN